VARFTVLGDALTDLATNRIPLLGRRPSLASGLLLLALAGCHCSSGSPGPRRTILAASNLIDFGTVPGGTVASQHVSLTNAGAAPLTIQALRIVDDAGRVFSVTTTPGDLAVGTSFAVSVTFTAPLPAGAFAGALEIDSNAQNAPALKIALAANVAASCQNTNCPPNAACAEGDHGPVCACDSGFVMENGVCIDLCATGNGGCDPNALCMPSGSTVACTCKPGFVGNGGVGTALVCDPVNLCLTGNGGCDPNAICTPHGAGVSCACQPGYAGNGQTGTDLVCLPVNACLTSNGGCDANALCTPNGTGVTCTCLPGYRGNGMPGTALVCVHTNQCALDNGGCDSNATCAPVGLTAVTCLCNPGYGGNGATGTALICNPINQCLTLNGGCDPNALCVQQGTGVSCTCDLGYTGNGVRCTPAQAGHPSTMNEHVCDIATDGALWCWGLNTSGQTGSAASGAQFVPFNVAPGKAWLAVAAGYAHSCGIQADGTLWCWGDNSAGELGIGAVSASATIHQVGSSTQWREVSAGVNSTCGIQSDGTLWCWGDSSHGQAGQQTAAVSSPSTIPAATSKSWTSVVCGHGFNCGIQSDQTLWCWGEADGGQLGAGSAADSSAPISVGTAKYAAVSAGDRDACAVRLDGTLWCWGWGPDLYNTFSAGSLRGAGQLPVQIGSGKSWASVAVNENACATQTDGSLWCAGPNQFGNLGTGDLASRGSLTRVGAFQTWQSAAVGAATCAETMNSRLYCWGSDDLGEIGDGASAPDQPTQVSPGSTWQSVALGRVRPETLGTGWPATYGVQTDGTLWEWGGYAPFGSPQLLSLLPSLVGVASTWVSVAAGDPVGCALDKAGALWCFGTTNVGNDSNAPTANPFAIGSGSWLSASIGLFNGCGLQTGGLLWCWGANADGELGNGSATGALMPEQIGTASWSTLSMGATHTCGLSGGVLWCWGVNAEGELGNGSITSSTAPVAVAGTSWTAVSAGFRHTCGLRQDNSLWCWGQNSAGEVGNGTTTGVSTPVLVPGSWTFVAASVDTPTTCGIKSDGSLWCWGQLTPILSQPVQSTPTLLGSGSNWKSVATDGGVCAIRSDGSLWCWGDNLFGQRGNGDAWRVTPVPVSL
jgi:alpha-tubulin suppressor-like RCC1 family protein